MTSQIITLPENVVSIADNQVKTSSLKVAEFFGRQHKNVLQSIENLDCSPEFTSANFSAHVQNIEIGQGAKRDSKYYEMTKDGFMFLVMGFTGKKAAAIKEAYINAFNAMDAELNGSLRHKVTPEQKATLQEIVARKAEDTHSLRAQVWARHNRHFKINSYHELLASDFEESVAYLEAMTVRPPKAQLELSALNQLSNDRLQGAFMASTQIAQQVQLAVLGSHADEQGLWEKSNWMFYFHTQGSKGFVASIADLASMIEAPNGLRVSPDDLANLARACTNKLAKRLSRQTGQLVAVN